MQTQVCECSEDFGPCEQHSEVLAQREGAAVRTADELAAIFIGDVEALRPTVRVYEADFETARDVAAEYWEQNPNGGWAEPELSEALSDSIYAGEWMLAELGLSVYWDDGFVIYRITGGPLA
jgi:hypothetical protein